MTADGGESSPISATRSGLVPAKGGAGKGRKQQSSLRSYFGFTAPAAPSPASPTSPAAPETPVQSQGGDTNTRVVPREHRQRKDWAGGMEKAQRRGVEPARTDFSEKEMELFRKLTERYQSGSSKRWVKISQAWDKAIQTWEGEECPYQPRTPKQFNTYFYGTWARHLEREQKRQKPDAADAPSDARQKRQRRPRDVLDPSPAPPQHNRRTALNPPSQPDNVQQPADNVQQPADNVQQPADNVQQPPDNVQQPPDNVQQPPDNLQTTSRQPAATSRQPPSTSSQPTGAPTPHSSGRPPAEVTCQPASIYHASCFLIAAQGTIPCCWPPPNCTSSIAT